ncbi:MAG: helix-turn-helix domain-containing protein [Spirochaetota bacterium]|nr:helix-turn-helix domain-containing protein [Spirochaetota bacterium]
MKKKNTKQQEEEQARRRAEVILQVRAGKMTAKEAAKALGVSRKTYYQWEERGLEGMMDALLNRSSGRPKTKEDPEKEKLKKENEDLKNRLSLSQHAEELRRLVMELPSLKDLDPDHPYQETKKKEDS